MHFLISSAVLLVLGIIAVAAHSHGHAISHGNAVSYSVLTKHDDHHSGYGSHGYHQGGHHGLKHHHTHHGSHSQYSHHGHHSHPGHAKYDFKYGVKDAKTGDVKNQWESRHGNKVKGVYSLKEADGTTRVVKYSADHKKGFQASVHKIGHAHYGGHVNQGHGHHALQTHGHYMHHVHGHHGHHTHHMLSHHVNHGQSAHVNHGHHGRHSHAPATSYVYINKYDKH